MATTCVLGYEPTARGREALVLAENLAELTGADLVLDYVVERDAEPSISTPEPAPDYWDLVEEQARGWLSEAISQVRPELSPRGEVRYSYDVAGGLLEAVEETRAALLVVGAAKQSLLNRYSVGSVAASLLHSSPVPVALAPNGYQGSDGIKRITCAIGSRPGWEELLSVAIRFAEQGSVPLRFLTLTSLTSTAAGDAAASAEQGQRHIERIKARARRELPDDSRVTVVSAEGSSVEDAVQNVEWQEDEIVLVGSSRLAHEHRIFLGNTANRMLKALPVPMVVVPNQAATTTKGFDND